ncbi:MAG TPA: TIM barrel protein [Spongiibacteraceae bacterium]|nr:TIM barrel protein [Spongiibacteraceae bacterium]
MTAPSHRIGIDFISFFKESPTDIVKIAAKLGCRHVSMALEPMSTGKISCEPWSLRTDKALRRDLLQALKDHHVDIAMGECYIIKPGEDFRKTARPDLEIMHELNIKRANIVSIDQDFSRTVDQCGVLVEIAESLGMNTTLEWGPFMGISNLQSALSVLEAINRPHFRLVIDAMHFFRSGATVEDLAKLDPNQIGYVQLCDVPLTSKYEHYMYEARFERLAPGQGELPLRDFLKAAPHDTIIGLEIPMLAQTLAGVEPYERMLGAVTATQALLDSIHH